MTLAATGLFALPVAYAAATLAASPTFQALVGAADANGALGHILIGETDEKGFSADGQPTDEPADPRPRAILDIGAGHSWEKVATTGYLGSGPVEMVLEVPTPAAYQGISGADRRQARTWFYNQLGGILADMQALAGQAGYLNIITFDEQNTGRADPKENDGEDFWVSVWNLNWLGQ